MREWLSDRRRVALLAGALVAVTIVVGVVWGAADAGGVEATSPTTTVPEAESTLTTEVATTTSLSVTTSSLDSGSTTAPSGGGTSGTGGGSGGDSGGDSGGGSDPTTPTNRPPSIEDPGISSDGMRLNVAPLIADPDSDSLRVEISAEPGGVESCEGCPPGLLKGAQFRYDPSEVGLASDVVVSIRVVDEVGNESVETFEHRLLAITTVDLRANFNMTGASTCFSDKAAVRLAGEIVAGGSINDTFGFSEELRPDRDRLLILEVSDEVVGDRSSPLTVSFNAAMDGQVDSTERLFTRSDQVLQNLFANQLCRGSLIWTVEFSVR